MKNKDELSKYICKNEKQLLKKIKSGAKVIMCYNFNITDETVNLVKENKIKIIGIKK